MSRGWHILRDGDRLTLARHLPARFDVAARTVLPLADPLRLAHQIRQDMWRALQRVRGFSPVVEICAAEEAAHVRAGGRVIGVIPPATDRKIREVLENPHHRARWLSYAGEGQ